MHMRCQILKTEHHKRLVDCEVRLAKEKLPRLSQLTTPQLRLQASPLFCKDCQASKRHLRTAAHSDQLYHLYATCKKSLQNKYTIPN